jgi:hypothetical protein
MRQAGGITAAVALAAAAVALFVIQRGDVGTFVPPPEAVVEGFMKEMASGRYSRAIPYLSDRLEAQASADTLRTLALGFERQHSRIEDARGEPGWIVGNRAFARARVKTPGGEVVQPFGLVRERGLWGIDEMYGALCLGSRC